MPSPNPQAYKPPLPKAIFSYKGTSIRRYLLRALLFIIIIIINWMCRFGWVDSINFIACHPSHPHHYDEFPIVCQKGTSIMRYLLGPGGLSARPPLAQCKDSTVTAKHVSIRSMLSKNHLRHPNHRDHNNTSIKSFATEGHICWVQVVEVQHWCTWSNWGRNHFSTIISSQMQ